MPSAGFIGMIVQLDNLTSNARTRELLRRKPTYADLLADIAEGHDFTSPWTRDGRRQPIDGTSLARSLHLAASAIVHA